MHVAELSPCSPVCSCVAHDLLALLLVLEQTLCLRASGEVRCSVCTSCVQVRAGLWHGTEEESSIAVPAKLPSALAALGLEKAVGYLWMVAQDVCAMPAAAAGVFVPEDSSPAEAIYVPYNICLGVPLYNSGLCKMVSFIIYVFLCATHSLSSLLLLDVLHSAAHAYLQLSVHFGVVLDATLGSFACRFANTWAKQNCCRKRA